MLLQSEELAICMNPTLLLQKLVRFNTTNPPGNEAECIGYINSLLKAAGVETTLLGLKPGRPNLVARLKGSGSAPPFLMYGHVDVVTAEGQEWRHGPFEGVIADGCIWGRGTLDMKGAIVMMVCAMIRAKEEGIVPSGDIILAVVCDEEGEGGYGSKYLVERHGDLFAGVRYAIGEVGGVTVHMGNKRLYPIMVAEKQKCSLKTVVKGRGGHGSIPMRGGAMAKLSHVLKRLNTHRLPVHITPPVRQMIVAMAACMQFPVNLALRGLLNPGLTDWIIGLTGNNRALFEPILHNTVNATIVYGGNKINVIPAEINLELDGRLLPGQKPEDLIREIKDLIGGDFDFSVTSYEPGLDDADMGFFDVLAGILRELDREAIPIPFVISAVTDARYFSRLGIQTYGFTPMILPPELDFSKLIHGADERIPVGALEFGINAVSELIKRTGQMK